MFDYEDTDKEEVSDSLKIVDIILSDNVAALLDDEELCEIATKVESEAQIDIDSMSEWLEKSKEALKMCMQHVEKKNFPWENASNIIAPLLSQGAITFAAREYPQIVRGNKVVEAAIFGKDPDGSKYETGQRVAKFQSWQLLVDSDTWELETDKLLITLAVVGTVFRKGYFSVPYNKPKFDLCKPDHIFINNNITSLEDARRVTHKMYMHMNTIVEHMRDGTFSEYDTDELSNSSDTYDTMSVNDPDSPHVIYEQHRFLDLDGDGYDEPYIVTLHKSSKKILRIVPRFKAEDVKYVPGTEKIQCIKAQNYFTDWHFIPSPDGNFFSLGLGTLLYPLNKSINTIINQIIDSGTLLNAQPIFMGGGLRIEQKKFSLAPGTINVVEGMGVGGQTLRESIVNMPLLPPSPVLLQLLELLIGMVKDIANISEILQGQQPTQNSPVGTVTALINQGLVQYNAVHKRVLRSFKKEFNILFSLNRQYLDIDKYVTMLNDPKASKDDFTEPSLDIKPVADPNMSSEAQRLAKTQAVYGMQEVDRRAAAIMMLAALDLSDIEIQTLVPPIDPNNPPPPPPKAQLEMAQAGWYQAQTQEIDGNLQINVEKINLQGKKQQSDSQLADNQGQIDAQLKLAAMSKTLEEAKRIIAEKEKIEAETVQIKRGKSNGQSGS